MFNRLILMQQCRNVIACAVLLTLSGCGGGGNNSAAASAWEQRTLQSDKLAAVCEDPRTGNDPYNNNRPYPDQQGTLNDEKSWLATYMQEVYLWNDEIPQISAAAYTASNYGSVWAALEAYFYALLTPQVTSSGKYKDEFSFVYPTDLWNALSQGGVSVGYGMEVALLAAAPPREAVVAFVDPGTPAAAAGIVRGAHIVSIDGEDLESGDADTLNAGLFPSAVGESHVFEVLDAGETESRAVTLAAGELTSPPVREVATIATGTGTVGYVLFNAHVATAEGALYDAISALEDESISDLVLDLRYNGGGYLDIAAELAYMIAGPQQTAGKDFERLRYNSRNPLAQTSSAVTPFRSTTVGFDPAVPTGTALPELNLARVFILAGGGTCSASEAIINGLRGIDVEVVLIGSQTCGKPYGFYAQDNCGLSYFAIEFEGVNDKGEGDYADGFAVQCEVADDFGNLLGDPAEALLATALSYRDSGSCPQQVKRGGPQGMVEQLVRSPLLENAWRRRP